MEVTSSGCGFTAATLPDVAAAEPSSNGGEFGSGGGFSYGDTSPVSGAPPSGAMQLRMLVNGCWRWSLLSTSVAAAGIGSSDLLCFGELVVAGDQGDVFGPPSLLLVIGNGVRRHSSAKAAAAAAPTRWLGPASLGGSIGCWVATFFSVYDGRVNGDVLQQANLALSPPAATTIDSAGGLPASDSNGNVRPPHLLDMLSSGRSRAMASFDPVLPALLSIGGDELEQ
nr:hypothetical protein Iba_chr12eCG8390 [Ipomoea batatas]